MSYQVLARKWRPRTFQELMGQEHVVRVLVNALEHNRLHHAFLFTGTRGIGKTTIARILAKALNCEQGVSATPCGVCAPCRQVDEGRFVDLIEVDAASRTKVEDTRELLENVQYSPTRGRYKVYLIDEVHMLSTHSFNALLKTLEEPPPHVKFLLATTDPQRLPVTILSRCLQFNLRRLPTALIVKHLDTILAQEGIEHEAAAVNLIAQAGDGSMRDALSLLDQAIAFGNGRILLNDVSTLLGSIDRRQVIALLKSLAAGDARGLFNVIAELDRTAPDYGEVLAELLSLLQRIAVTQVLPEAVDETWADHEAVRQLATLIAPEDVQLFYQIALVGRRDLPLCPELRGGLEMILLRMLCFRPVSGEEGARYPINSSVSEVEGGTTGRAAEHVPQTQVRKDLAASATPEQALDWGDIVARLGLKGVEQQLALNCVMLGREGNTLRLSLQAIHAMIRTKSAEERLRTALEEYYGEPLQLSIQVGELNMTTPAQQQAKLQTERLQAAVQTINSDPNVQALCETFNARIKPDSIGPSE
jgi:DNA polymerase-3 subunit gamma/tau